MALTSFKYRVTAWTMMAPSSGLVPRANSSSRNREYPCSTSARAFWNWTISLPKPDRPDWMDCKSSNSIFTLQNRGMRACLAHTRNPACKSSTFRATVFMATDLPPMLAPVITAAPRSREMDTGTKERPCSRKRSHSSGLIISVSSRAVSVISGRTPPYRWANSAF